MYYIYRAPTWVRHKDPLNPFFVALAALPRSAASSAGAASAPRRKGGGPGPRKARSL